MFGIIKCHKFEENKNYLIAVKIMHRNPNFHKNLLGVSDLVKWIRCVIMMAASLYVPTHPSSSNVAFKPSQVYSLQIGGIK